MDERQIIACLDIKDGQVVKGVNFINLREVGDPLELGAYYERDGADELAMLDITATVEGRKTFFDLVSRMRSAVSLPITVGGGIRSADDAARLFDSGASKVSVSSQAVAEPALIDALAERFGSERIVLAVDARRSGEDSWTVVVRGGREESGRDCCAWIAEASERGAGQILLTSMDCDGAKGGYDLALYQAACRATPLPIIASGGAGTMAHFVDVFTQTGVSAALGASIFHFHDIEIPKLKIFLQQCGIPMRTRM